MQLYFFHLVHSSCTELESTIYAQRLSQSNDHTMYGLSRDAEIFGLLEQSVFSFVPRLAAAGNSVFKSRFCDDMKDEGLPTAFEKSRFVVMA